MRAATAALAHRHVHRAVTLHAAGEAPLRLLVGSADEPSAQRHLEDDREHNDHQQTAQELGAEELPPEQDEQDYFFMNVYGLLTDLLLGFLIAGALGSWVSNSVWSKVFLEGHGALSEVWGALIGPLVAVVSFVCSVGNVPLAAVLWRGGISFGGVIAFIFADLIILPILNIYRKYYGRRVAVYLFVVSYLTMALVGLLVGLLFNGTGLTPTNRLVTVFDATVSWNYDTFLNIAFLLLMAVLLVRFLRTGGVEMLRMMEVPAKDPGRASAAP